MKTKTSRLSLSLLCSFVIGCSPGEEPDFSINGVEFLCYDECPDPKAIEQEMDKTADLFRPHISEDPWGVWEGWRISFNEDSFCREGRAFYKEEPPCEEGRIPVYGATKYRSSVIWIWYPYDCPDSPKGLCNGVFHWEIGLPLVESEHPDYTEAEKLQWREERCLLHPYQKDCE